MNGGQKGASCLNLLAFSPLERLATRGPDAATMAAHLFVCTSVIKSSNRDQSQAPQYWEDRVLFANLDCSRLLQEHVYRCLLSVWRMGTAALLRAEITSYLPSLPWQLQVFSRLQSSTVVTSDRFCKCTCSGGKTGPGVSSLVVSGITPGYLCILKLFHLDSLLSLPPSATYVCSQTCI